MISRTSSRPGCSPGRSPSSPRRRPAVPRKTAPNLEPVYAHQPPAFTDVDPVNGADEIVAELRARGQAMESNVRFLEERLRREVSAIAADFDPGRALEGMLGRVDLLRARRVLEGDRRLPSAGSQAGVVGLLEDMR